MDMPKPGPEHAKLQRFVGSWIGDETLAASPWGPGGEATGRSHVRVALDGMSMLNDYEEEKDGKIVFRGHGVFGVDPQSGEALWWWFDSMGIPPLQPSRGKWDGDTLVFTNTSERGTGRYTYRFDGRDRYHFRIENKFPGQAEFSEFMHGDYRRA